MTKYSNPNYRFQLPPDFVNAKESVIVVRQGGTLFGRIDNPFDYTTSDTILLSDFIDYGYLVSGNMNNSFDAKMERLGYVCLYNENGPTPSTLIETVIPDLRGDLGS
jgi:hypothetical protein